MEEKATEVLKLLDTFRVQWKKYVEHMDKLGRSIDTINKDYDLLVSTRKNQLEKPLKGIEALSQFQEQLDLVES